MHAIAIDDEPKALEVIKHLAAKIPFLQLQETFTDALEAMGYVQTQQPDLVFLDINMPDISGLDWVKGLSVRPHIIFTTAFSEYAAESYELEAVDYLVKPISFNRFVKAVNRAARLQQQPQQTYTFVKSGHQYLRLDFADILYVQSAANYVDFFTEKGKETVRMKLSEAMDLLPDSFVQVHRSYLVHLAKVQKVEHNHVYVGQGQIAIGQAYREEFMRRLTEQGPI